jgi:hypothetical protein
MRYPLITSSITLSASEDLCVRIGLDRGFCIVLAARGWEHRVRLTGHGVRRREDDEQLELEERRLLYRSSILGETFKFVNFTTSLT